ncbi:MAG: glycosyltransferase family 4 protein [Candidatus Aminicenantes bacterium]|nr:MAG: glycosyltransferase family 4 protein [Candidatus Aminicenantes bacterium]
MKILHLVHAYYPAVGGSEYLMQQVSEYLAREAGDDVTVFTTFAYNSGLFTNPKVQPMAANKSEEVINHVKIKRFPVINRWAKLLYVIQYILYRLRFPGNGFLRMLYYGPISPEMKKAAAEFEADVIVSAPFPLNHMNYGFKNRNKAPVVLVGCMHTADKHGFRNPRIGKMIHKADGYIALTPHEKDFLVKQWGIDAGKIEVIGVGIDIRRPALKGIQVRKELGIGGKDPVIAFVGQHGLHKGIDTLIRAMPEVWGKFPNTRLIIAGGTTPFTDRFKYQAQMIELAMRASLFTDDHVPPRLPGRIHFIDNVDENKKYQILEACDIFASPSGFESFGITILEAWSKKKPVVVCNIEVSQNLVQDGETGFLVEYKNIPQLAETLRRLIENPGLRKEIGEKGFQTLKKNYSQEMVGKKYREFYKKFMKND